MDYLDHNTAYKWFTATSEDNPDQFLSTEIPELSLFPEYIKSYESLHKFSVDNSQLFWKILAKTRLNWMKEFNEVTTGNFRDENFMLKWFLDGKLNVSVNCVDRHYSKNPKKIALIWEKDEPHTEQYITYEDLYKLMNQIANMLKAHSIKKGDRVTIYMPTSPMAVACMLACARIGAVHNVVFAGFSAEALANRINDSESSCVITANQGVRGGKIIDLKKTVDTAIKNCPSVSKVFIWKRTDILTSFDSKDVIIDEELPKYKDECEPEEMDSEDPLFMLYTSGSTGKPKGLIHTQAGYLLYAAFTFQTVFDYKAEKDEVFGCLADIGWITGHSYVVYGPLCNGGTTVLFESTPIYPDAGRYWETVQRLRINQIYLAPTALRLLIKYGNEWVTKYDRSSLKVLGSVGEPINSEAWHWYYEVVGEKRCKIADTFWQTETGGHVITPLPSNATDDFKPCKAMRPFFGIELCLVDDEGNDQARRNSTGKLCIKNPWPGMARTIYGDHQRFLDTYLKPFYGYYFTGDGAESDAQGHFRITGRVDDVINVSGHRIGTAEVENALCEHASVAEAAVVPYPHEIFGEGIFAYIVLKDEFKLNDLELIKQLQLTVKSKIAHYAIPNKFQIVTGLPKTRSGKIMRRILRKIAENETENLGDISTLAEPSVVQVIIDNKSDNRRVY